jgi:hypothetical protein
VQLLDVEAVLSAEPGERAARGSRHLRPDPVAGEAGDDVPAADSHLGWGVEGKGVIGESSSRVGAIRGRTSGVVSVGVCAVGGRVSVDLP